MKKNGSITLAIISLLLLALVIGCSNDNLATLAGPENGQDGSMNAGAFEKKKKKKSGNDIQWPIFTSKTYDYNPGHHSYKGGVMEFGADNKSKFILDDWALTAPAGFPPGQDITLTMTVDYDSAASELLFEFGPHGCQFDPRALVKMDYNALGVTLPVLFYIDETGNRIEMQPEQINANKKWLMIRLDHFSRYAVAISRCR